MFIWFTPGLRQPRSCKKGTGSKMYKNMKYPFRKYHHQKRISCGSSLPLLCPHSLKEDPQKQPNCEKGRGGGGG